MASQSYLNQRANDMLEARNAASLLIEAAELERKANSGTLYAENGAAWHDVKNVAESLKLRLERLLKVLA